VRELFVYYRVRNHALPAAREAVLRMQRALRIAHPDLVARLLRRRDGSPGVETWMETYAVSGARGDGVDASIESAIASASATLASFIDGERHVEAFQAD
jgi:hypothetical protein